MRRAAKPQKQAMYVAPSLDKSWLLSEQCKLYTRSWNQTGYVFAKLWGLVTDPRTLRVALARVAANRGARSAGIDGMTVRRLVRAEGVDAFTTQLRAELRSGAYRPQPVRRVLIPKAGQPGKYRPLGVPTVKDRVVQMSELRPADFVRSSMESPVRIERRTPGSARRRSETDG